MRKQAARQICHNRRRTSLGHFAAGKGVETLEGERDRKGDGVAVDLLWQVDMSARADGAGSR